MGEGMRDQDYSSAIVTGKIVKEVDDFAFRPGIEPAGDLVAEEKLGVGDKLHSESQASLLSAGEDPDVTVGDRSKAGLLQDAVDALVELLGVAALDPEASCSLDCFIDRELVVSDGELRNVANLPGFKIAFLGEIAFFPPEGAPRLGIEAGDGFEQSSLTAARGADDGHEVASRDFEAGMVHQIDGVAVFLNSETDLLKFEHD